VQSELCCLFQSEDGSAWIHPILVMGFEGNDHGVTLLLEHRSRVRNLLATLDNVRVMRAESMSTWSTNRTLHTSRMSVISRHCYVRLRRGLHCLTGLLQQCDPSKNKADDDDSISGIVRIHGVSRSAVFKHVNEVMRLIADNEHVGAVKWPKLLRHVTNLHSNGQGKVAQEAPSVGFTKHLWALPMEF
jgi:hypothetical protein